MFGRSFEDDLDESELLLLELLLTESLEGAD
jgi:hypothetical protein